FLLMMATAFMGYVLPWGQMSFWGATVITGFFSAIPWVGDSIQALLLGGFAVANPTLNRFYSLHYLLPFMIAGVVILHVWALHVTGQTNPTGVEVKNLKKETVPFTPYATIKDALALVIFFMVFAWFVFYLPDYLGHADNYIPADPLKTPTHIVPEWYFLPFYAILRAITFNISIPFTDVVLIDSKLGGVIAMFASIAILAFLPWLDTSKVRSASYRPLFKQFFWIFAAVCVMLGWLGSKPAEGIYPLLSLIFTIYYFAHFLIILPLLGWVEKPKEIPASIADAVLTDEKAASGNAVAQPAE
ncbi:MAG: cytochrome b, partial [Rhizobiaceae bacterium]